MSPGIEKLDCIIAFSDTKDLKKYSKKVYNSSLNI